MFSGGGLEFILLSVKWGGLKFTLFSGVVWSLYCCVKDRVGVWTDDKWWSLEKSWSG